ncbi:MAG: transcription antitermination factor NusB, partial [Bacteroidales bacterium]|nr:transcription antitermination factor NusB [Bacteroidales bacterium]
MISRRILRIKTMQALYSYYNRGDDASINKIEKELTFSIQKSYDLYHYLMILIVDISLYAEKRIEIAKNKRLATTEDLNPNTKFIDNRIIEQIRINNKLLS